MGRAPCPEKKAGELKKGPWTPEEDRLLVTYIQKNGHGSWRALPELAGLLRCGKSCRLRWTNYLRPDIKRGSFTEEEERTIIQLHGILGNRWSAIASQLPGRTDNEIKNFWSTRLKKRLLKMGLDPATHAPRGEVNPTAGPEGLEALALTRHKAQWENARLEAEARLSRESLLMSSSNSITTPASNNPAPCTDYFLKLWNSEAGKAFRNKETHHPNRGGDNSEIPVMCCASTGQNSCDQLLNPNDKDKHNGSQLECGDCNVKTGGVLSCFGDMATGKMEDKTTEELDFPELLLDFPDNDDMNSNIQSELITAFQQKPASPWPQLHDQDFWSNLSFIDHDSA